MSPEPDPDVKREASRHRPAIIAIVVVLLVSALAYPILEWVTPDEMADQEPADELAEPTNN